ncbi:hypothetical protein DPMN_192417 [Dreissena polymorpha]|uniref:Uncharacterized protein n=1 Tax=Dreissena polymorpha TaxID=45954 RepID=A0A9D4BDW5_DREPO|nr:hypothetical protein DPMN_192417 [Dreissena polymorpha]
MTSETVTIQLEFRKVTFHLVMKRLARSVTNALHQKWWYFRCNLQNSIYLDLLTHRSSDSPEHGRIQFCRPAAAGVPCLEL